MFKLGKHVIEGKVVLAPMAGYTFHSYRKFMTDFGVALCYSEMVSDMGLIYDNDNTKDYVIFPKEEVPVGIQLFGSEPENLAKAVGICEELNGENIDFYDVNMACPVPKVTKSGAGSSLLKDPKKCGDIIRAMKAVTDKPVTAKIRLGWDKNSINFVEVIKELEEAGVALIAIHARTAKDMYMGEPHFDLLKDLRSQMKVPLIISGNIFNPEDAKHALDITGADAVMVARGGVGNPYLISNINRLLEGKDTFTSDYSSQMDKCLKLARMVVSEKGEAIGIRIFRSMASRFFNGIPNSKKLKARLSSEIVTYKDLESILWEYKRENNIYDEYDEILYSLNPLFPITFLLDATKSKNDDDKRKEIYLKIDSIYEQIKKDDKYRYTFTIIQFGEELKTTALNISYDEYSGCPFAFGNKFDLVDGLNYYLDSVRDELKDALKHTGYTYEKPLLIIITDGKINDVKKYKEACDKLSKLEKEEKVSILTTIIKANQSEGEISKAEDYLSDIDSRGKKEKDKVEA